MNRIYSILLLALFCCTVVTAFAAGVKTGSITGTVMIRDSVPMANGEVRIFNDASGPPPSSDKYWRVPDVIVKIDADGKFVANLAEGTYYIGALQRKLGENLGPPRDGDMFLPFHGGSSPKKHVITSGSVTDIGVITGAKLFNKSGIKTTDGVTAIEGKVTDSNGNPVENTLVFAFLTPEMRGKPLFVSDRTSKDGTYLLRVHQGGNYFLKIRSAYGGGALKAGEIVGGYGQEKPMAVEVKTGATVKEINITGIRFSGQGPKIK